MTSGLTSQQTDGRLLRQTERVHGARDVEEEVEVRCQLGGALLADLAQRRRGDHRQLLVAQVVQQEL